MTRMYLICAVIAAAILFQSLSSRPPETVYEEPKNTTTSTTNTSPKSGNLLGIENFDEDRDIDLLALSRKALRETAALIQTNTGSDVNYLVTPVRGSTLKAANLEVGSGVIKLTAPNGLDLSIDVDQVKTIEGFSPPPPTADDTLALLTRAKQGDSITDQEIENWLENDGAEELSTRYPLKSSLALSKAVRGPTDSTANTQNQSGENLDLDELDEWMSSVRDDISKGISSNQRTTLILEIDQWISLLQSRATNERISRWSNQLRILKLDLIKSTGF
ncbi:MAG: hypothetical protein CBC13_02315 [Planctomycetia bacterium TMED53]|nr:MAG: hypothetical protein CBC13_02315 [Planctomycetia bacterium TMED53]